MKKVFVGKSSIHGNGLFAAAALRKGDIIFRIPDPLARKKPRNHRESMAIGDWIGRGRDLWFNTDNSPTRFLNHSCNPNAAIVGTKTLVAIRDIACDEEILMDYSLTDADEHWYIRCECGAAQCRKMIKPIQFLPEELYDRHKAHIPPYFRQVYRRAQREHIQRSI